MFERPPDSIYGLHQCIQREGQHRQKYVSKLITLAVPPGHSWQGVVWSVGAKGGDVKMAKRRANGEGNIRKRSDGRWEGRYTAGRDPNTGKAIYKNVLAKTQKECKEKLKRAIEENARWIPSGPSSTQSVSGWTYGSRTALKSRCGPRPTRPTRATSTTTSSPALARSRSANYPLWIYKSSTKSC